MIFEIKFGKAVINIQADNEGMAIGSLMAVIKEGDSYQELSSKDIKCISIEGIDQFLFSQNHIGLAQFVIKYNLSLSDYDCGSGRGVITSKIDRDTIQKALNFIIVHNSKYINGKYS